jgi:hypothetical protein
LFDDQLGLPSKLSSPNSPAQEMPDRSRQFEWWVGHHIFGELC